LLQVHAEKGQTVAHVVSTSGMKEKKYFIMMKPGVIVKKRFSSSPPLKR